MKKPPLSRRPLGYVLAVAGGILGGAAGLIVSPLVLCLLGRIIRPTQRNPEPNRFRWWALIGVIGAPVSLALSSGPPAPVPPPINPPTLPAPPAAPTAPPQPAAPQITLVAFEQVQTGMTYDQVVGVLGGHGEETSATELGGTKSQTYTWRGGIGQVVIITFTNGTVAMKTQTGLR